ncbi:hypothetical protein PV325_008228, partial [Microctonus aethiopoides]
LCGLAVLICGVLVHIHFKNSSSEVQAAYSLLGITIIVIGGIMFVITFFGCYGAIRENRCMLITFGIFILILLLAEATLSCYVCVMLDKMEGIDLVEVLEKILSKYWWNPISPPVIDSLQFNMKCCGIYRSDEYTVMPNSTGKFPWSCCPLTNGLKFESCESSKIYSKVCREYFDDWFIVVARVFSGMILVTVVFEAIGILFTFYLAASIKYDKRWTM